ncbi:MAG TPA: ATP-dependent Clp protease proteolytic subunit, partial [Candidatus Gracilibacteria bacterium]|nr:ATP-dependent Clp protease proteolytic subunit [Candidatus Gracilibacteria bacterium]
KPDVATVCLGMAASGGSVLLVGGTKGKRAALKHSEIMIHQPLGGAEGQATDISIAANHILKTKDLLIELMAERTGQKADKVRVDMERDFYMSAEQAKDYGIIDLIFDK